MSWSDYIPSAVSKESATALLKELFPNGTFSEERSLSPQEVEDFLEIIVAEGLEPCDQSDGQFTGGLALDEYFYEGQIYHVWYSEGYLNIEVGTRKYY